MNRGQGGHQEFKGLYYNEVKEQRFYEGGAHFRYSDLYSILEKMKQPCLSDRPKKEKDTVNPQAENHKTNNNNTTNKSKTRNINRDIDKINPKQLTSYNNNMNNNNNSLLYKNNNFINQYFQSKNLGISLYTRHLNKNSMVPNPRLYKPDNHLNQPKSNSAKRTKSRDHHTNRSHYNKAENEKSNSKAKKFSYNTQKVLEYSDKVKQHNMNSARSNHSRNTNRNNNHNGNSNTFVINNPTVSQKTDVRSRNAHRGNDFFDNNSFYTKSECMKRDKKDITSIKNTIDKTNMFNKTIASKKIVGSMSMSNKMKQGYIEKYQKITVVNPNNIKKTNHNHKENNISTDSQKRLQKSFIINDK